MLISLDYLISEYGVDVSRVLHLGAHLGEEAEDYDAAGAEKVVWVEANPNKYAQLFARMKPRRNHATVEAILGQTDGEPVTLNIANNGESSSVLPLGTHKKEHREVRYVGRVEGHTVSVDTLCRDHGFEPTFINIDLQGIEGPVLAGAVQTIQRSVDDIYAEVNEKALYVGCTLLPDLDAQLDALGFDRVETMMTRHGWGDALYTRRMVRS